MIEVLNFFTVRQHFIGGVIAMIFAAGCIGHIVSCWRGHD